MNQLKVGTRVFSIHHSDGKAHPTHCWLEEEGTVKIITIQRVDWGKSAVYNNLAIRFLEPSIDGFCYYMAELSEMEQYKDGDLYKVPTDILKKHMKSYKSPWEVEI